MKQCTISNVTINGAFPKSNGNCAMNIHCNGMVTIKDVTFTEKACAGTRYNGIEIGLSDKTEVPSIINIDNVRFEGSLLNNGILVFGTQDNAVINIRNCYFKKLSNALRFSNHSNAKNVTVNIIDCVVDEWDKNDYAGLIICEDYTSKSKEEGQSNNLYAPEKLIINITNLTHAGKKLTKPEDISTILGSGNDQILYVYGDKEGLVAYDRSRYPTVNIF